MEAYFDGTWLVSRAEGSQPLSGSWIRVPSEDKIIVIEE